MVCLRVYIYITYKKPKHEINEEEDVVEVN